MKIVNFMFIAVLFSFPGFAATIIVPDDAPAIQDAIGLAAHGDTILVKPGTYMENIDFSGKGITVKSEQGPALTCIDGNGSGSVVSFTNSEGADSVLDGFTITNGTGTVYSTHQECGGGVYLGENAAPVIRNNIITDNEAKLGAGIFGVSSSPQITNNTFSDNYADNEGGATFFLSSPDILIENNIAEDNTANNWGGGFVLGQHSSGIVANNRVMNNEVLNNGSGGILVGVHSSATIVNNVVCGNVCADAPNGKGGGIDLYYHSEALIVNNTVYGNSARKGGGIACRDWSSAVVKNTILWNNEAPFGPQMFISTIYGPSTITVSHCDVQGGESLVHISTNSALNWGDGMIDEDPQFVNPLNHDLHLTWLSACINRGTDTDAPVEDMDGDIRPIMGSVDMGADEFLGLHPLSADVFTVSETGGTVDLSLDSGTINAGRRYLILGSTSGTGPGHPLPSGQATLRINWDPFTDFVYQNVNLPVFSDFFDLLDGSGQGQAQLVVPMLPPGRAG